MAILSKTTTFFLHVRNEKEGTLARIGVYPLDFFKTATIRNASLTCPFVHHFIAQTECLIFLSLHDFAFTRSLVVNATKVEDAVNNNAMEFFFIGSTDILSVRAYGVERNKQVATDFVALGVVEGDDVRVVIMLKELAVDLQNFFIVNKDIRNGATSLAMCLGYGIHPSGGAT